MAGITRKEKPRHCSCASIRLPFRSLLRDASEHPIFVDHELFEVQARYVEILADVGNAHRLWTFGFKGDDRAIVYGRFGDDEWVGIESTLDHLFSLNILPKVFDIIDSLDEFGFCNRGNRKDFRMFAYPVLNGKPAVLPQFSTNFPRRGNQSLFYQPVEPTPKGRETASVEAPENLRQG